MDNPKVNLDIRTILAQLQIPFEKYEKWYPPLKHTDHAEKAERNQWIEFDLQQFAETNMRLVSGNVTSN